MSKYRQYFADARMARSIKWDNLIKCAKEKGIEDTDEILELYWVDEGLVIVRNNDYTVLVEEECGIKNFKSNKPVELEDWMGGD